MSFRMFFRRNFRTSPHPTLAMDAMVISRHRRNSWAPWLRHTDRLPPPHSPWSSSWRFVSCTGRAHSWATAKLLSGLKCVEMSWNHNDRIWLWDVMGTWAETTRSSATVLAAVDTISQLAWKLQFLKLTEGDRFGKILLSLCWTHLSKSE